MDYEQLTTHYFELASQMLDEAFGENRLQWIEKMEGELPKIRGVFQWLDEQNDGLRGLHLAYLLQELWFEERFMAEGLNLIQQFLQFPENSKPSSARAKPAPGGRDAASR